MASEEQSHEREEPDERRGHTRVPEKIQRGEEGRGEERREEKRREAQRCKLDAIC